ncbi:MAG: ABC transporter substrate-binding protein [Bdellovibrionales bacterium]|nr:ABC transporter substrate-binding protein [Bdellovibrionales bacterium]
MRFLVNILFLFLISLNSLKAEQITLKIGVTLPLSGRLAHIGQDIQRGLELGIEDFESSKLKFEFLYEDNQHKQSQAVSAAHKLMTQDKVDLLISLWDMADVVAPIAERKNIPHLAIRWNPQITEKYKFTMTMESTYQSYVNSQIELLKRLGVHTVGLLAEENQGWILGADYFQSKASQQGLIIYEYQRFLTDGGDLRPTIQKVLNKNPDIVVLFSNSPYTELLIKRIRERKPNQQITGYLESVSSLKAIENIPFVAQFAPAEWFVEKFKRRYGQSYLARAPQAYDLITLIADTVRKHGKQTGLEFVHSLNLAHNLQGASGILNSNGNRNIESQCVWRVAKQSAGSDMQLMTFRSNTEQAHL